MSHMVVYRRDGVPAYQPVEALEDAVRVVERLRNEEQVAEVRLFRMEEVPLEFKTYYRVEVGGVGQPVEASSPAPAAPVAAAPSSAPAPAEDEAEVAPDPRPMRPLSREREMAAADAGGDGNRPVNGRFGLGRH